MLTLAFLGLLVQLSKLQFLSRFESALGFYEGHVPVSGYLSSGIWILVYEHPCRRDSPFNHTPKPHFFLTLFVDDLGDEFVGQLCA